MQSPDGSECLHESHKNQLDHNLSDKYPEQLNNGQAGDADKLPSSEVIFFRKNEIEKTSDQLKYSNICIAVSAWQLNRLLFIYKICVLIYEVLD